MKPMECGQNGTKWNTYSIKYICFTNRQKIN